MKGGLDHKKEVLGFSSITGIPSAARFLKRRGAQRICLLPSATLALSAQETKKQTQTDRQRQTKTDRDRQRQTETDKDRQIKTETKRDRERQTETDRNKQTQTETDRDKQRQTETDRDRQRQTETDKHEIGLGGRFGGAAPMR